MQETNEKTQTEDDDLVKKLDITDPFIFASVFGDPKYAKPLLEAFLGIKIERLEAAVEVLKQVDKILHLHERRRPN